jgi:thioredoxin 1
MPRKPFKELINEPDTPVLVDFYADWCGPCQTLSPIVKEVAADLKGKVKVIKIDVDKNQPLAQKFGIRSIPTLMLFKHGQVVWKKAGLMTKRDLTHQINHSIN